MMRTIPLTQGLCAIVDDEHYDYLNQWKWRALNKNGNFYAARNVNWNLNGKSKQRSTMMHRVIAGITGFEVDHVNHDTLDNRSENLRVATRSQNMMNRRWGTASRVGIKGVCKYGRRFQARIIKDKTVISLGVFDTKREAALAYNRYAVEVFGDRACLNPIGA